MKIKFHIEFHTFYGIPIIPIIKSVRFVRDDSKPMYKISEDGTTLEEIFSNPTAADSIPIKQLVAIDSTDSAETIGWSSNEDDIWEVSLSSLVPDCFFSHSYSHKAWWEIEDEIERYRNKMKSFEPHLKNLNYNTRYQGSPYKQTRRKHLYHRRIWD